MVGGVDLERIEMCGNAAPGVDREKVCCNGYRECRALFRIRGRPEFVKQYEGVGFGFAGDAIKIDDMRGEAGEIAFDRLRIADVGVDAGKEREAGFFGGNWDAGLSH